MINVVVVIFRNGLHKLFGARTDIFAIFLLDHKAKMGNLDIVAHFLADSHHHDREKRAIKRATQIA